MSEDQHLFLELESDQEAIDHFVAHENAATENTLMDQAFNADRDILKQLFNEADSNPNYSRYGERIYTFRTGHENPRGQWLRLSPGDNPSEAASWTPVFDLDVFCQQTGMLWEWRGAVAAWCNPDRGMLCLSENGSDKCRWLEFDCTTKSLVEDGFDIPPETGFVDWIDENTLLWSTAAGEGETTASGWPRVVKKLTRGSDLSAASILFEATTDDLLTEGYVVRDAGAPLICVWRYREIGQEQIMLLRADAEPEVLLVPPDTVAVNSATHYAYIVKKLGGQTGVLMVGEIGGPPARQVTKPSARRFVVSGSLRLLQRYLLWTENDNLNERLFALDLTDPSSEPVEISVQEKAENIWVKFHDAHHAVGGEELQLWVSGFFTSPRMYLFDFRNGVDGIVWRKFWQVPEAFDASDLKVELLEATSDDGTEVPYHLVAPINRDPSLPILIYGYGGYGISSRPHYTPSLGALWLSRGGGYALAYIRGGGEFGPDWHLDAVREKPTSLSKTLHLSPEIYPTEGFRSPNGSDAPEPAMAVCSRVL